MKTKILSLLAVLLVCVIQAFAQTTVFSESFETNGEVSRYNSNRGGVCNDFFDRVSSTPSCFAGPITGVDGTWYFAGEDVDNGTAGGGPGSVTFVNHSISGLSNLQLSFKFGTPRAGYEIDDVILVQYSIDGGSFTNAIVLQGNPINGTNSGPLKVDTDRNPTAAPPTGADVPSSGTMSLYSYSIPGTGSNIVVKVVVDVDGGTEEIAFDLVKLEGTLAVNFPPVLANIEGASLNYTEGDPAAQVTNTLSISDTENDNITSATVEISAGFASGEDVLSFTSQFGVTGSQTGSTLSLSGIATLAQYQTVLRSVKYQNTNTINPSIATRTIRFQVSDGGNSNFQSRNINFTQTLNGPISLPACESFETDGHGTRYYAYEYASGNDFWQRHDASGGAHPSHGQAIIGADGNWIWVGEDVASSNPNPSGLGELLLQSFNAGAGTTFSVDIDVAVSDVSPSSWETNDYLKVQYKMDAGAWTTIGAFYGDASNNLVADANLDGIADPAGIILTNTLQRFTYNFNTSGTNLQVRVQHKSDGTEEIAFDRICVDGNVSGNAPPVLANIEAGILNYVEGSGVQQVTNSITVSDAESDNITGATIVVFQGFDASEDVLSFTPQFGVVGAYVGNTLTLTGSATPAQYQTLLRSVSYQNTDGSDPSLQNRTIQFQVSDGAGSNFQTRDISIDASLQAAQSLPYCESFETDGHGVRYAAYQFNDASNNFWERHDASGGAHPSHGQAILGATGSYIWVGEDVDEASNPNPAGIGEMLLTPFNVTSQDSFTVSVNLAVSDIAPLSWEASDYVVVEYKMDAGAWTKIGAFYGDGTTKKLTEDADLNGIADPAGTALTNTLAPFTYGFTASGGTLQVRLLHKSDGSEELGFDNFCITGFSSCNEPDIPTISTSGVCNPQTLSITSGNLNDATNWHWYTGSCGGTSVGTGNSIIVSPNSSTIYYVRGEGGCVTLGACASVTVGPDGVAPNPVCQNITVYLNAAGTVTIVAADVDGGSTDNCGVDSLYVDKTTFTCADVETDTVSLTVFDAAGNFSSCNAIVTIEDTISPVISCPGDVTVSNDAGVCGATVAYAISATDNCGVAPDSIPGFSTLGTHNGKIYYVSNIAFTPQNAYADALANGGYVVTVNNAAENTFLAQGIANRSLFEAWIGYDDSEVEGTFVWQNGEVSGYSNWDAGNPDNAGNEDYVELKFYGVWNDRTATTTMPYILERNIGIQQIEGIASGGFFPVGVTVNKFVAVDDDGNSDTCSFTVTVNDTASPTLFTDSICLGDSLYVGGAWQTVPGVYTDTATAASGCDSLLVTTLYYQADSICHSNTPDSLLIVSDASWMMSTEVNTVDAYSYPWRGVTTLPDVSTYTLPAVVGQPYHYHSIDSVDGARVLRGDNGIRFFRTTFNLNVDTGVAAQIISRMDDGMEIYINGHMIAREANRTTANFLGLPHNLVLLQNGDQDNGHNGDMEFDIVNNYRLDSVVVAGENELIIALRNAPQTSDKGGFSFRMELKTGEAYMPELTGYLVSDIEWMESTVTTPGGTSFNWSGVSGLPAANTFTKNVMLGQPYGYYSIEEVPGSFAIKSGTDVTYYTRRFTIMDSADVNVRLRSTFDESVMIYVNGVLIAADYSTNYSDRTLAAHDVDFQAGGTITNGNAGGDLFDQVESVDFDNILRKGDNYVTVALRNKGITDKGGFSLRLDLDKAGSPVIRKTTSERNGNEDKKANDLQVNFNIYPNPTTGRVIIDLIESPTGDNTVTVLDLNGKVIMNRSLVNPQTGIMDIDLSELANGMYIIRVKSGDTNYQSKRVMKF
ncbi:HYR domain-containing protein [Owenweeksia hongkongensis DSM 17368]|uniref:HYR domain-containing protein n=1 Tax=Owenweeksia hongkongensis (strain DSM 17368 / CIP 108786 / JCM 12287 / NRRL B-23963 / UST20020801) TaxID=926562 RepID=G8R088_OWEHD|nr:T9SS type A sorting domain-containing protein [Owenweeksia hongkongensis]AEV33754.1 HYR domain-containing protein [Owenweeksia hongkongensis DSM 17368]